MNQGSLNPAVYFLNNRYEHTLKANISQDMLIKENFGELPWGLEYGFTCLLFLVTYL